MQEETEEQANEALNQYEQERLDSWEDWSCLFIPLTILLQFQLLR
jgi:hypothetical protein